MAYRVIQWATGAVGSLALKEIIRHPDLELVGVLVYSEEKEGKDAGELVGLDPTGVLATRSRLYPDSIHDMGYEVGAAGFELVLSKDVATALRQHIGEDVTTFLTTHGLTTTDIGAWIVHPGGPKIIDAINEALDLSPEALELTWRSLGEVGNLSSASVLHVLRDTIAKPPPSGSAGLMIGMGAGLCSELVLLRWH